jgi:hypothetical protein
MLVGTFQTVSPRLSEKGLRVSEVRVLVAKNGEKSVQMCSVLASWGPTFGTRKDFSDSLGRLILRSSATPSDGRIF